MIDFLSLVSFNFYSLKTTCNFIIVKFALFLILLLINNQ